MHKHRIKVRFAKKKKNKKQTNQPTKKKTLKLMRNFTPIFKSAFKGRQNSGTAGSA